MQGDIAVMREDNGLGNKFVDISFIKDILMSLDFMCLSMGNTRCLHFVIPPTPYPWRTSKLNLRNFFLLSLGILLEYLTIHATRSRDQSLSAAQIESNTINSSVHF